MTDWKEIDLLLMGGKKLEAIHVYKRRHGGTLYQAKKILDKRHDEIRPKRKAKSLSEMNASLNNWMNRQLKGD